ncbi:MAG: 6-carboxytetrahydropterin synthase [Lachnospiraceae bacterium]|nr:6-carboxytetrahydropterin synthase [Lachnospiraceae bacterium]
MLHRQYKYKFYLNMNHSVEIEGQQGAVHSHTWEITMRIAVEQSVFVRFSDIEEYIDSLLGKYQDKYLNSMEPFNVINPILENVCDYFFEYMTKELWKKGWLLMVMEMSETPSRIYQVSGFSPQEDYTFTFV